jgi:hypothetical protein
MGARERLIANGVDPDALLNRADLSATLSPTHLTCAHNQCRVQTFAPYDVGSRRAVCPACYGAGT